jgi:hypothetical protein
MDEIFKQAPDGMTYDEVKKVFIEKNENVLETLMELWKVPEKPVVNISENEKKWEDIRNTCDDFDSEMQKTLKRG